MESLKKKAFLFWPYLLLFGLSFWVIQPLFHIGFFPMHDNEQIARVYELDQALRSGQFPPRLVPDLGFGYGYLFFNFYPSFAYYVSELFRLLGFSYIIATKLMIVDGVFLAALGMYFFSKRYLNTYGALLAGALYTYTPYHAVDLYVRGAFAEFWSIVFLPWIFYLYTKLWEAGSKKYVVLTSLVNAFLILSHDLIAMVTSFFLGMYLLYLLLLKKEKIQFLILCAITFFWGLFLSAYFWIPSIFEKQYTIVDTILTKELANYRLHFVYIQQFWNSPWGYGGSAGLESGLSFQIGKAHLLLGAIGILVFLKKRKKMKDKKYFVISLFFILFLLSLFLQTAFSQFIWDKIQPLWYIQFPWRLLIFTSFFISFLGGAIVFLPAPKKGIALLAASSIVLIILYNAKFFKPSEYLTLVQDIDYTNDLQLKWYTTKLSFEYVPSGIATYKSSIGNTQVDITRDQIKKSPYQVISGVMSVRTEKDLPQEKFFSLNVSRAGKFRINAFFYPGWKVFLDDRPVVISADNKLKLLTIDVPNGRHSVKAEFTNTFPRIIGNLVSFIAWVGLAIFVFYSLRRNDKILRS